jgi:hypothetical protein
VSAYAYDKFSGWTVELLRYEERADEYGPYQVAIVRRVGNPPPGQWRAEIQVGEVYDLCPQLLVDLL